MSSPPTLDHDGLHRSIAELATIGAIPGGGVCRLALTDEDGEARQHIVARMRALGLEISIDQIGNIFGLRRGRSGGAPVATGSHIDTVRTGGRYDGTLGVLAAFSVIEALNAAELQTQRPVQVCVFTNEEGARFQPDMMGSLVATGALPVEEALATTGIDGTTVAENLGRLGYHGGISCGALRPAAFVELHIEQGPVLERAGQQIGAVEGVQGIAWSEFIFEGATNHAGTTPMAGRRDSGFAAAAVAAHVRSLATEFGGDQVATVGRLELFPNLVNVIPGRALLNTDLRNTDDAVLTEATRRLAAFAAETAAQEGVALSHRDLARFAPVPFDPRIVATVERYAETRGHSVRRMPSGAGHDAQMLAAVCPTGMIFVPSAGGVSHNAAEYSSPHAIEAGADLLLDVLLSLANTDKEFQ